MTGTIDHQGIRHGPTAFQHEALFYDGPADYVDATTAFLRDGIERDESILVAVPADRRGWLRDALGLQASRIRFEVMEEIGRNPARIIPVWQAFIDEHRGSGRPFRGIGEPIWAQRSGEEIIECHRHEALINLAFADTPPWRLLCPYDAAGLDPAVLDEARRTHPILFTGDASQTSDRYEGLQIAHSPMDDPLPEPATPVTTLSMTNTSLLSARHAVAELATSHGLSASRAEDLVLAVSEVLSNSLLHAAGGATLRIWAEATCMVCEVRDSGRIADPLAGRVCPALGGNGGAGLWLVNQLCDLVQIRNGDAGCVVRMHMLRD